jgi:HEPN domain-containing protein
MRDVEELHRQVAQWKKKADADYRAALTLLKAHDTALSDVICFHAQQVIEKYIKAYLVLSRIGFPKTHQISELSRLLPQSSRPDLAEEDEKRLSDYAVAIRYPGEAEHVSLNEAEEALGLARRVRMYFRKKFAEEGA